MFTQINRMFRSNNEPKSGQALRLVLSCCALVYALSLSICACGDSPATSKPSLQGKYTYQDFDSPAKCGECHTAIYDDWSSSMMSRAFTHEWNSIEYFSLALSHSAEIEQIAGTEADCMACHSPLAYLSGDIPPGRPSSNTRANEGVSCDVCHSISGSTVDEPYNFSYVINAGNVKYGPYAEVVSPYHDVQFSQFHGSSKLCATCHDRKNTYGTWVKNTYREWMDTGLGEEGIHCQDCHMRSNLITGDSGSIPSEASKHSFQGARSLEMLESAIEVKVDRDKEFARAGQPVVVIVNLTNVLCGHSFPTGSAEERMLWLKVQVTDPAGRSKDIPVDAKGFTGEEYTIADSAALGYQDLGQILEISCFEGLARDGNVPDGARIFRQPYFNPKGQITICQWFAAGNTLVDYRLAPNETVIETFTFVVPDGFSFGRLEFEVTLSYSLLPSSIAEFFNLPEPEYAQVINQQSFSMEIVDWGN
jgi:hypothetical protein